MLEPLDFDPLAWIDQELESLRSEGLWRELKVPKQGLIDFASNDYLGFASDPRLTRLKQAKFGAAASPLVSGWTVRHERLRQRIRRFEGTESAILFPTGYAANLGAISALVGKEDAVYLDRLNHACLIDGAKLSGASIRVYRHCDATQLDHLMERDNGRFRRRLIATDGVFSMDGDVAPIADLVRIAQTHKAILLVDEAHGTGVYGPDGKGSAAAAGVSDQVHIKVGTLSKAVGAVGGFVAGSKRLTDYLVNRARPLIYSTSLPIPVVSAARHAFRLIVAEPERRERLWKLARRVRSELEVEPVGDGPIVPFIVGDEGEALKLAAKLRDRGLHVPAIRPPTVPVGSGRLRISIHANHTDDEIDRLIAAIRASW